MRDQVGCPTYTAHLADALAAPASTRTAFGIHHIAGGGECSWYEFAEEIFRQSALDVPDDVDDDRRAQPRPRRGRLLGPRAPSGSEAIHLPDWQEGLAAYLAERAVAT